MSANSTSDVLFADMNGARSGGHISPCPLVVVGEPKAHERSPTMTSPQLEPYKRQRTVLLTTFRKNGTPVGTPVSIAVDRDRAYLRTWDTAGKFKRLRRRTDVEVEPSTLRGRPTGPKLRGHIRILDGEEAARARRLLARKYPLLHGVTVPLMHRLKRYRTVHLEFVPVGDDAAATGGRVEEGPR